MSVRLRLLQGSARASASFLHIILLGATLSYCAPIAKPVAVVATTPQAATPPEDAEAWRQNRPASGPTPVLHAPKAQKKQLENGLTLISVHKDTLPLVQIAAVIKSGSAQDPAAAAGLASFMADLLKMGTRTLTAQAIAEATETQGTSLDVHVDEDSMTLTLTVLKQNVGPVLDILADVLRHPRFAAHEFERARKLRLNSLAQVGSNPVHMGRRVFREVIFGTHPYGHIPLGTATALHHIKRRDLQTYYTTHVRPANMAILVVGDLTAEQAETEIGKRFGQWRGDATVQEPPSRPDEQPTQLVLVPRPKAPQSQLMVGALGVARNTPDFYPLVMCNAILGGLFNSRLNMNLREEKGWTYDARSAFNFMRQRGTFFVATGVRTDVTAQAIREVLNEIAKMRDADVTEEELRNAKNRYSLSLPGYFQTVEGVADMMANLYLFDLPADYYQKLPENLASVSIADVRRVATTYLHPDKLSIIVVGDPETVGPTLAQLGRGSVVRLDAQGQARAPTDTKPQRKH